MFWAKLHIFIKSLSILNGLPSNLHKVGLIFWDDHNKGSQPYVSSKTTHFYSNPSYASQSILNGLSPNLHKVGLYFSRRLQQGVTTLCFKQNCTFSSISLSILNRLPSNLHKVGLIFWDDCNKGSQPYVLSKTAHFHQYLSQFLMDCLQTFTK